MEGEGGFVCRPPPPLRSALSCACIAQTLHAQDMGWLFEYTKSAKTVRLLDSPECARREPAESWSRWVRAGTRYWHRTVSSTRSISTARSARACTQAAAAAAAVTAAAHSTQRTPGITECVPQAGQRQLGVDMGLWWNSLATR